MCECLDLLRYSSSFPYKLVVVVVFVAMRVIFCCFFIFIFVVYISFVSLLSRIRSLYQYLLFKKMRTVHLAVLLLFSFLARHVTSKFYSNILSIVSLFFLINFLVAFCHSIDNLRFCFLSTLCCTFNRIYFSFLSMKFIFFFVSTTQ